MMRAAFGPPSCFWRSCFPEFFYAVAYVDFLLAHVLPEAAPLTEAADFFFQEGAFEIARYPRIVGVAEQTGRLARANGFFRGRCSDAARYM